MTDLSAGRPLLLPDLFTEDDVDLVATAITKASGGAYDNTSGWATYVLNALAAAGRLLPPGAERQWRLIKDEGTANESVHHPAERDLVWLAEPGDKKLSRWAGPWVEVDAHDL